jgi:Ku70/Ku80 beta-barrel domain
MAPRAYWKGYLRLSLVTWPIELFPAVLQSEKTHFHQINTESGHRLRQQMVDETTGEVVDKAHKGRGYERAKGRYVQIDEDELAAVEIESTHTVDIDSFVPLAERQGNRLDGSPSPERAWRTRPQGARPRTRGRRPEQEGRTRCGPAVRPWWRTAALCQKTQRFFPP